MQQFEDFHVHTTFCDGKNTPEQVVLAAIAQKMTAIGFSAHVSTPYTMISCPSAANYSIYLDEIHRLQDKYSHKIQIWCGIEQDYYSDCPADAFDYSIGSVHHVLYKGTPISIDHSLNALQESIQTLFSGDIWPIIELYYEAVSQIIEKTNADLIGHFDLITKFSETADLFDKSSPRYKQLWVAAADTLLKTGKPFEINTGAISRGYRTSPYPSMPILEYLTGNDAQFVLNSDSHSANTLCFQFDHWYSFFTSHDIPLIKFDPSLL